MPTLEENIHTVRENISSAARNAGRDPAEITLVAATKVQTSDAIRRAIAAGIAVCGENRVQEFTAHLADGAYAGARVHFIGHLQTNKVKYVVGQVDLIESVSSRKLLDAVNAQAEKLGIVQDILLEVNIGGEESKSGFSPAEAEENARYAASLPHVRLLGLMCIPPASPEPHGSLPFFEKMHALYVDIRRNLRDNGVDIVCLSMGMSGDYQDAVAAGATMVRVGTALFGPRPPVKPGE